MKTSGHQDAEGLYEVSYKSAPIKSGVDPSRRIHIEILPDSP
jgi:hypothetical protein